MSEAIVTNPPVCLGRRRSRGRRTFVAQLAIAMLIAVMPCAHVDTARGLFRGTGDETGRPSQPDETSQLLTAAKAFRERVAAHQPTLDAETERASRGVEALRALVEEHAATRDELAAAERALADAREKAAAGRQLLADTDRLIAEVVDQPSSSAPSSERGMGERDRRRLESPGTTWWSLARVGEIERFFLDRFGRPLPVSALGQSALHDRFRLDHRSAVDVALSPDSAEGAATIAFLRASGIPFTAFSHAIPGVATGAHIHIGYPSHRY